MKEFRMAIAASQGMLDQLIDVSAIRAAAEAAAAEAFNPDIKRRKTLDAEMAERIECRKAYSNYLYVKQQEAGARRLQTEYLTFGEKKWLDLVSMCRVGYWDFDRHRAASQISADQNHFNSHPVIHDGPVWEKHLVEQLDAYEGELADSNLRWWTPTHDEYLGGPKHLHAIAQTWCKLRLLRTPLAELDYQTRRIVAELRVEHFVAPQVMQPNASLGRSLTLSAVVPELLGLNAEARSIAEHSIVRECLAERECSGFNTPDGPDPRAAILRELRRHPEIFSDAIRIGLQRTLPEVAREPSPCPDRLVDGDEYATRAASTNNVVIFPSSTKVLGAGTQIPLPIPGKAKPPQRVYLKVGFEEGLSEGNNKETFAAATAVIEEHGGKQPTHFSMKIKRKISETTGITSKKIEGSYIPDSLSKQVTRFLSIQKAYNAAARHFPKGYPLPFDEEVEDQIATKLRSDKIPKEGVEQFLSQLRQLAKNRLN
jgi:hypothetical protein